MRWGRPLHHALHLPSKQAEGEAAQAPEGGAIGTAGAGGDAKEVVYRGRGMRIFRVLVRLKLAQLGCAVSLTAPLAAWANGGMPSPEVLYACGALALGAGGASWTLWYYSSRYVGELALLGGGRTVRFSTLDFWGNREDVDVDVGRVVPPLKGASTLTRATMAKNALVPVNVEGVRQYVLSLRYGIWVDKEKLFGLMEGTLNPKP